jgi:hypothetical protein
MTSAAGNGFCPRGIRVSMVKARWAARQRPGLPDAQEWSTALALAVIQTLLGQRPVAHPNRSKRALAGTCNLCRRGPHLRHLVLGQPCVRLSAGGATNLGAAAARRAGTGEGADAVAGHTGFWVSSSIPTSRWCAPSPTDFQLSRAAAARSAARRTSSGWMPGTAAMAPFDSRVSGAPA